jgi:hypothetical protein
MKEKTSMKCPKCSSERIVVREAGKKTGGTVGAFTGAAAGVVSVMRGAQVGAAGGIVLGPLGAVAGGLAGAAAAVLLGGSAGAAIGSALGSLADESFLDNRHCLSCELTFREDDDALVAPDAPPSGTAPNVS